MTDHLIAAPDTRLAREAAALLDIACDAELAASLPAQLPVRGADRPRPRRSRSTTRCSTSARSCTTSAWRSATTGRSGSTCAGQRRARAAPRPRHGAGPGRERLGRDRPPRGRCHRAAQSPETRIANRGISVDVRGAGADVLSPTPCGRCSTNGPGRLPERVHAAPRPGGAGASRHRRFSWLESVAAATSPGSRSATSWPSSEPPSRSSSDAQPPARSPCRRGRRRRR